MPGQYIDPTVDERGVETHPSWALARASKVAGKRALFGSDVQHDHFVRVTLVEASRARSLHRDWLNGNALVIEFDMSLAQWGAFVSSFGDRQGVPATISAHGGQVPQAPFESRLAVTAAEVADKARDATADVRDALAALEATVDGNEGKRAVKDALRRLQSTVGNLPANMRFAADSLTEHTEEVVSKARADIEAMVADAVRRGALASGGPAPVLEIGVGDV